MAKAAILKDLIKELDTNVYQFEAEIGVKRGRVSAAIERDSDTKVELVEKIVKRYPQVSKDWLMTGKGDMFLEDNSDNSAKSEHYPSDPTADFKKRTGLLQMVKAKINRLYGIMMFPLPVTDEIKEMFEVKIDEAIREAISEVDKTHEYYESKEADYLKQIEELKKKLGEGKK